MNFFTGSGIVVKHHIFCLQGASSPSLPAGILTLQVSFPVLKPEDLYAGLFNNFIPD
jgi:hypothetical protein